MNDFSRFLPTAVYEPSVNWKLLAKTLLFFASGLIAALNIRKWQRQKK